MPQNPESANVFQEYIDKINKMLEAQQSGDVGSAYAAASAPETRMGTMKKKPTITPEERLRYLEDQHTSALLRERGAPSVEAAKRFSKHAEDLARRIAATEHHMALQARYDATKHDERIPEHSRGVKPFWDSRVISPEPAEGQLARLLQYLQIDPSVLGDFPRDLGGAKAFLQKRGAPKTQSHALGKELPPLDTPDFETLEIEEMVRESVKGE
tara:strand:+ start:2975 stop:3613 length:639 start_codon:yes stop_codon:yes gene_type:complete